jgi:hypothetical protein
VLGVRALKLPFVLEYLLIEEIGYSFLAKYLALV